MSGAGIFVIGPGRIGKALAYLFNEAGYELLGAAVRSDTNPRDEEGLSIFPLVTEFPGKIIKKADIILITTPDDQMESVCRELFIGQLISEGAVLIHTSGYHSSSILNKGPGNYHVLSMHPLQSVPDWKAGLEALPQAKFFLEGDEKGLQAGKELVESIGASWVVIQEEKKKLYHAAAVIFSNYLTGLVNLGLSVYKRAGIDDEEGLEAALPLMEGTLENIKDLGPAGALTGPIARGDVGTVLGHLEALREHGVELLPYYIVLGQLTLDLAREKGLAEGKYQELKKILQEG